MKNNIFLKPINRLSSTVLLCFILLITGKVHAVIDSNNLVDYVSLYLKANKPDNYDAGQNASEHYQKAIDCFIEAPEGIKHDNLHNWPATFLSQQVETVRQWLKHNQTALSCLKSGAGKLYLWEERKSSNGSMIGILLPGLPEIRSLSYLLCYQAKQSAIEGNFKNSIEDIIAVYQVGRHFTEQGTFIEQAFGSSIKYYAIKTAIFIIQQTEPNREVREFLFNSLQKHIEQDAFIPDIRIMKFLSLDCLQRIYICNEAGVRVWKEVELRRQLALLNLQAQSLVLFNGRGSVGEHHSPELVEISYENSEKLLLDGLEELEPLMDLEAWQLNEVINDGKGIFRKIQLSHPFLNTIALQAVNLKFSTQEELKAQIRGLNVIREDLKFKETTGEFPDNISELQEAGLLQEIPLDPYSGEPIKYKKTEDDFIVYSFGLDLDDDDGKKGQNRFPFESQDRDLIIWPIENIEIK